MAAPKGNQFWKQRTKHGRDKIFTDPAVLWQAACDYFEWCDKNPWHKVEQLRKPVIEYKKDGVTVKKVHTIAELPTARPYTLKGLCLFLDVNETYWRQFNETNVTEDFSSVISRVNDVIFTQKFEGAAVGAFNANIISRDLGLVDKSDVTSDGKSLVPYEYVDSKGNVMRW